MTSTRYLDKTQQRNIEWVIRVLFGLLLHSKCQKATLAMILMIQSAIYPWPRQHWRYWSRRRWKFRRYKKGRQGRTIACNSQLKLSSNDYISFRDLPLLYKKIGRYLNILLSNCCCWIKCLFCISICLSQGLMGDVVWQKARFACLVYVSVVGQVFSPQM